MKDIFTVVGATVVVLISALSKLILATIVVVLTLQYMGVL